MGLTESNGIKCIKCLKYTESHHHSHHHPSCHHNLCQKAATVICPEEGSMGQTGQECSCPFGTWQITVLLNEQKSRVGAMVAVLGRQHSQPWMFPRIENSKQIVWNLVPALLLLNPSWPCTGDWKWPQLAPSPPYCWEHQWHVGNDFTCGTTQVPLAILIPAP